MYRGGEGIETWVRSQAWKGANNTISTAMVVKAFDEDLGEVVKLCQFEGINKRHAYSINAAIQQKAPSQAAMPRLVLSMKAGTTVWLLIAAPHLPLP